MIDFLGSRHAWVNMLVSLNMSLSFFLRICSLSNSLSFGLFPDHNRIAAAAAMHLGHSTEGYRFHHSKLVAVVIPDSKYHNIASLFITNLSSTAAVAADHHTRLLQAIAAILIRQ